VVRGVWVVWHAARLLLFDREQKKRVRGGLGVAAVSSEGDFSETRERRRVTILTARSGP
jgi:hypothetical protein